MRCSSSCGSRPRYLVELNVTHHDGQVERHTVAYLAEQPWGWEGENGVGTIIDNGVGPVKGITARDRSSVALVCEVFDDLFPAAAFPALAHGLG